MNEKILMGGSKTSQVWTAENLNAVGLDGKVTSKADITENPMSYRETKYIFSTWGMPSFTEEEIKTCLPSLRAVFYGAGSVQGFARPFLNVGVAVFSARGANAVPVAESVTAQIILANKGYFTACRTLGATGEWSKARAVSEAHRGNYGATVGIVGCGVIGRMVIERLRAYRLNLLAFDAFLSDVQIAKLGAKKVPLDELFAESDIVTNHLANVPATVGMLGKNLFASMKPNATFINTGRGATVVQNDLVSVLRERPDLTALLDVLFPEPPKADDAILHLPNAIVTPHISGSQADECGRMGAFMVDEYFAFLKGQTTGCGVTKEMLATMA